MKIKKSLFIFLIVFSLVPLYLMTGILTYNRAKDSRNYLILLIITAVCVTVIILAGNIFVTGQFIHPIEQLEYTLKRIQETGNYSLRILVQGQNKIRKGVVNTETGRVMKVTCSIGVVVALGTEIEYEDLIHEADMAMYEVKEKGKDSYVVRYKIEGTV